MNRIIGGTIRQAKRAVAFVMAFVVLFSMAITPGLAGYEVHAAGNDVTITNGATGQGSRDFDWSSVGAIEFQNELTGGAIVKINNAPSSRLYTIDLGESKVTVIGLGEDLISGVTIKTSASAITLQALNLYAGSQGTGAYWAHGLDASNDITINTVGDVTLKGADYDISSGGNGLNCSGSATIIGDIKAVGGNGQENGGDGIRSDNGFLIISAGSIIAKGGIGDNNGGHGIYAEKAITISGGAISASGGDSILYGGDGILASDETIVISASSIIAKGGDVTSTTGINAGEAIKAYESITIAALSITATGGANNSVYDTMDTLGGHGIESKEGAITIYGNVTANGGNCSMGGGRGIYTRNNTNGFIHISGNVDAKGGDGKASIGGDAVSAASNLTITGISIKATGGSSEEKSGGTGIYGGETIALTGSVTAIGGKTKSKDSAGNGIWSSGDQIIMGNVNAKGGNNKIGKGGAGIGSLSKIELSGSNIFAIGGDGGDKNGGTGIYANNSLKISGNATAKGGNSTKGLGGVGIVVYEDMITSGTQVTARGGDSTSSAGGFGIEISDNFKIYVDSVLKMVGGKGSVNSVAIPGGKSIAAEKAGSLPAPTNIIFESTKGALYIQDGKNASGDISDDGQYYYDSNIVMAKGNNAAVKLLDWMVNDIEALRDGSKLTDASISVGSIVPKERIIWLGDTMPADNEIKEQVIPPHTGGSSSSPTNQNTTKGAVEKLPFDDIKNHWAADSIMNVYDNGLMNGTGDGKFTPNGNMTRGMAATILGRFFELENGMGIAGYTDAAFADVLQGKYYFTYVNWGADKGIINGTGTNAAGMPVYEPEKFVTREQMAKLIDGHLKTMNIELNENSQVKTFTDQDNVSDWARESVLRMQSAGIITGRPDGSFDPQGLITRAEAAAMLERLMKLA